MVYLRWHHRSSRVRVPRKKAKMEKELILILPWHWLCPSLQPVVLVGRGRIRGRIIMLRSTRCGFLRRLVGEDYWGKFARVLEDEMGEEPPDNVMRKQKRKALTTGAWQPSWTW